MWILMWSIGGVLSALFAWGVACLLDAFPDTDFATLDRLYLPAGEYRTILLGGLPERSACVRS
jgi:hypothetical protein